MTQFHGVIPPIITPYDEHGALGEVAFGRLVDWYAEAGCHGLWVCGGTGEGVSLSADERAAMIDLVAECVAGRLQVIFHVAAPTTTDAVAAAKRCHERGLDAICSVPPFFYGKSQQEVVTYYRRLAEATDRPLFLYNLPEASGVPLTLSLIEAIVEHVPTVAGLKQSAGVVDLVGQVRAEWPHLQVLIGRGETTLAALTLGAQGVVCASLCLAPQRFVAVYDAFRRGNLAEALTAQTAATAVKEVYRHFPVIASTKWINSRQLGIDCGPPREPLAQIAPDDEPRLAELAHELGLLARGVVAAR